MDMREASAMTEVSGLTPDQEGVENAVGATPGTAKDMDHLTRIRLTPRCASPTSCAN